MPPSTDNPFKVLGLEPRFDIDTDDLHHRFVAASAGVHPDRSTDPEEQLDLARRAAQLNQAYRTLKDPESRAGALLELVGGNDTIEHRDLPTGLLEQMLEIREQMAEATADANRQKLDELNDWAQAERKAYLDRIARLFDETMGSASPPRETLINIRRQLNALRYIERMIEQLDPDYEPLGDVE